MNIGESLKQKQIGEKIKLIRKDKKITQKQLGELIGKKEITVRKYESGEINPNIEILKKISIVLDVPLIELIDENKLKDVPLKGILSNTNENSSIEQQVIANLINKHVTGASPKFEELLCNYLDIDYVQQELNYEIYDFTNNDLIDLTQFMFNMLKLKIIEINSKHK